jgi:hypothetical protein
MSLTDGMPGVDVTTASHEMIDVARETEKNRPAHIQTY